MNSSVFFLLWYVAFFALSRFESAKIQLFTDKYVFINDLNPAEWIGLVSVLVGSEFIVELD
jgi:hypothetical protein